MKLVASTTFAFIFRRPHSLQFWYVYSHCQFCQPHLLIPHLYAYGTSYLLVKHPFYTPKRAPPSRLSGLRLDFIGLEAGGDWWRNVCGEGTNVTCGYAHSIQMWPESNGSLTNIPPVSLDPLSGPTIILAPSSSYRSSTVLSAPFYCDRNSLSTHAAPYSHFSDNYCNNALDQWFNPHSASR